MPRAVAEPTCESNYEAIKRMTEEVFLDPQVGDHLHEMYSFDVFVVWRQGDWLAILEGSRPCDWPDDARIWTGTVEAFRRRFSYAGGPPYSKLLMRRGEDVRGWLVKALCQRGRCLYVGDRAAAPYLGTAVCCSCGWPAARTRNAHGHNHRCPVARELAKAVAAAGSEEQEGEG